MKKNVPAVFFQRQLNGPHASVKRPRVLEIFESELGAVFGGVPNELTICGDSRGWADVEDPDDTHI
jgi:hypothetical protein